MATGNPINENKLEPILAAYHLARDVFAESERGAIEAWIRRLAEAERGARVPSNNWESKRLKLVGYAGLILGDQGFTNFAMDRYRDYVAGSLRASGSSADFEERDALAYHVSGLSPLLAFSLAVSALTTVDLYRYQAPSGASVATSVNFVDPYATGARRHEEFVNSKAAIDKERREAGIDGYKPGTFFDPKDALDL